MKPFRAVLFWALPEMKPFRATLFWALPLASSFRAALFWAFARNGQIPGSAVLDAARRPASSADSRSPFRGSAAHSGARPCCRPASSTNSRSPFAARRPLANPAADFFRFWAGSEGVGALNLGSPLGAAVPGDWSCGASQKATQARIRPLPAAGAL
jgi:hypothetical protein